MRNETDTNGNKNWRPKYMPELKREEDLFVPEENIHFGKHFEVLNSSEMEVILPLQNFMCDIFR